MLPFQNAYFGWSDGGSLIPIQLSMLSVAKKKNCLVPMRGDLDK